MFLSHHPQVVSTAQQSGALPYEVEGLPAGSPCNCVSNGLYSLSLAERLLGSL
jgi:hypothetical protein